MKTVVVIGAGVAGICGGISRRRAFLSWFAKRAVSRASNRRGTGLYPQARPRSAETAIIDRFVFGRILRRTSRRISAGTRAARFTAETEADLAYYENWLGHARPFQLDSRILTSEEVDDYIGGEGRYGKALSNARMAGPSPAKPYPPLRAPSTPRRRGAADAPFVRSSGHPARCPASSPRKARLPARPPSARGVPGRASLAAILGSVFRNRKSGPQSARPAPLVSQAMQPAGGVPSPSGRRLFDRPQRFRLLRHRAGCV